MIRRLWLIILLVLALGSTAEATRRFVRVNGDDAADGLTWATAKRTPRLVTMSPGDTLVFGRGTYYDVRLTVPRTSNSGDRTCYECSTIVNIWAGQAPVCSLTAGKLIVGSQVTWTSVATEVYSTPFDLGYQPMENDFSDDYAEAAFQNNTFLRSVRSSSSILTAPRGHFSYGYPSRTFYVRTSDGSHPSGHRFVVSGESLVNIPWNDSLRQFFTIRGFHAFGFNYAMVSSHASADSIFIEDCSIRGIGVSQQNNGGVFGCNNIYGSAEAGGVENTYRWDGRYNRVKRCYVREIWEALGGSDSRCCVVTTYGQSYFSVDSCIVEGIGGLMHPKNRGPGIGGYSYGNVARYNVCRNLIGAAYHTMNFQRNDSCYGNIFINSIGAVYLGDATQPSGPGHYFGNNTIYGLRNEDIFRPHPGGSPPTQNMAPNWAKYNIFYDDNASSGYIMAFYGAQDDTSWVIDSNLYYNCESTFYGGGATNFAGWQNRQSGTSVAGGNQRRHDLNSTFNTKNPAFANAGAGDFSRPTQTTNEMQVTYGGRTWTRFGAIQPGSGQVNAPSPLAWIDVDSLRCDYSAETDSLRARYLTSSQAWPDSVIIAFSTSGFPSAYQGSSRWALPYPGANQQAAWPFIMSVIETDTVIAAGWILDNDSGLSVPVQLSKVLFQPITITVQSPNGGESWLAGSNQTITWNSVGNLPNVRIEYSTNGGANWTTIIANTPNDGSHAWTTPSISSSNVLIRVADTDGTPSDVSNGPLTISSLDPPVTVAADSVYCDFNGEQDSIRIRWQTTAQTFGDSVVYALTTTSSLPTFTQTGNRGAALYVASASGAAYLLPTVFEADTVIVGAWVKDGANYSGGRYDTLILYQPPPQPLVFVNLDSVVYDYTIENDSLRFFVQTGAENWPESVIVAISLTSTPPTINATDRWARPYSTDNQFRFWGVKSINEPDTVIVGGWVKYRNSWSSPIYSSVILTPSMNFNNIEVSELTSSSATVTWNTNLLATTQVEYGLTSSYGLSTVRDANKVKNHTVFLTGLSAATTYHYRVISDYGSGPQVSADSTFLTSIATGGNLTISGENTSDLSDSSAVVVWSTSLPATSQVEYGASTSYGYTTSIDAALVTDHDVSLRNLTAKTNYHFRVITADASGNRVVGQDQTFRTARPSGTNMGRRKNTDASSSGPGYSPLVVTDTIVDPYGGSSTIWQSSATGDDQWIELDLGIDSAITRIVIYWAWNESDEAWTTSQQFSLQRWTGSSFQDALIMVNPVAEAATTLRFPDTLWSSRIRLFQPAGMGSFDDPSVLALTEIEVYGRIGFAGTDTSGLSASAPPVYEVSHPVLRVDNLSGGPSGGGPQFAPGDIYYFEVATDSQMTDVVAASGPITEDADGNTEWTIEEQLEPGQTYYWQANVNQAVFSPVFEFLLAPVPHSFPNPFNLNQQTYITFTALPAEGNLLILTPSGETVRRWTDLTGVDITWDGRNESGNLVSAGVYLWFIENSDHHGKIVLIK